MDITVSAVIPLYNNIKTIGPLLDSLRSQSVKPDEIIAVDDVSSDGTREAVSGMEDVKAVLMEKNSGPAAARNAGAQAAAGEIILFLDSDVVVDSGAVEEVKKSFAARPEMHAINGVMEKEPLNPSAATRYKALMEYRWGQSAPQWDASSKCINARVGAIRRDAFLKIGGFDLSYPKPSVEDYEFGLRFTVNHPIYTNRNLKARHHFSGFFETIRNYYNRTSEFVELTLSLPRPDTTDKGGTSKKNAIEFVIGFAVIVSLPLAAVGLWQAPVSLFALFALVSASSLKLHLAEGGIVFYFTCLLLHMIYGAVVTIAGAKTVIMFKVLGRRSAPEPAAARRNG